jgi:hypothetical protein
MDLLDELRIRYRRLRSRYQEAIDAHRAEQTGTLLAQLRDFFREKGFQVSIAGGMLESVQAARVVVLRADHDEEIRIGEFLGFTFTDSLRSNTRRRIVARLQASALPEHAPIDVNTRESIQAQIDYMTQRLAEGARALQDFEVKGTITMANYREPEPDGSRLAFTSLEEAVAYLLAEP